MASNYRASTTEWCRWCYKSKRSCGRTRIQHHPLEVLTTFRGLCWIALSGLALASLIVHGVK